MLDMDNEIWFGPNFVVGLDFGIAMSDIDATGGRTVSATNVIGFDLQTGNRIAP